MWVIFSQHTLDTLVLVENHLNATANLSINADHPFHPFMTTLFTSLNGYLQQPLPYG